MSLVKIYLKRLRSIIKSLYFDSFLNGLIKDNNSVYVMSYDALTNIGDEVQSIASADLLKKYGYKVRYVEREKLSRIFSIFRRKAVMNGWFSHDENSFPPTKAIDPIFIGFHLSNRKIIQSVKSVEFFKKKGSIGCRDIPTRDALISVDVTAHYTACPTLTLDARDVCKTIDCMVVDAHLDNPDGHTSDARELMNYVVKKYGIENITFASQNCEKYLTSKEKIRLAEARLEELCASRLVITNRIHVALPCLAMNVPVIFIHANPRADARIESFVELFWYKTENEEDLPDVDSFTEIKNKTDYLELRKSLIEEFDKHLKH